MNLIKRDNPFDLASFFDTSFPSFRLLPDMPTGMVPAVDITERADSYVLKADFPGMKKEEIEVSVENGVLTLSAEHKEEKEEKEEGRMVRRERRVGRYARSFTLDQPLAEDQIEASFDNGLLTLILPKAKRANPAGRRIEIH